MINKWEDLDEELKLIRKRMELQVEVAKLVYEYHDNKSITAATEMANKFYELIEIVNKLKVYTK